MSQTRVGIVSGGQLGRMMLEALPEGFAIETWVLDSDPKAPCFGLCDHFIVGSPGDEQAVYDFGKNLDKLVLEFEHVNLAALRRLKAEGVEVFPDPEILAVIQDKGRQKEFYRDQNLPTAEFSLVDGRDQIGGNLDLLPAVQKTRAAGYDGKGIQVLLAEADLVRAFDEPSVLERKVDFAKELSVVVARDQVGNVVSYPVVEQEFHPEHNLVEFLFAPAEVSLEIVQKAKSLAENVISLLGVVGVAAVELFLTKTGELLVNEVAPRVHNSGHHTIEANTTSQFAQYWRVVLGQQLGSTQMVSPAVMINLLGADDTAVGEPVYDRLDQFAEQEGVYIHLYGKNEVRPARKMGHVTVCDSDLAKAKETAKLIKQAVNVHAK